MDILSPTIVQHLSGSFEVRNAAVDREPAAGQTGLPNIGPNLIQSRDIVENACRRLLYEGISKERRCDSAWQVLQVIQVCLAYTLIGGRSPMLPFLGAIAFELFAVSVNARRSGGLDDLMNVDKNLRYLLKTLASASAIAFVRTTHITLRFHVSKASFEFFQSSVLSNLLATPVSQ